MGSGHCQPFIETVSNLLVPHLEEGLDIFKTSYSVSGAAKILMMIKISKDFFFCLYPKCHADLFMKMRSQLTSGLSIMFSRMAVAGETPIRPHQFEELLIAQRVLGIDASSLYLSCVASTNPTGFFCRYKKEENYRPDPCTKYGLSS